MYGRPDHHPAGGGQPVIGNPYYRMLGLMTGNPSSLQLAMATLTNYANEHFEVEGKQAIIAGRAAGVSIREGDEGSLFLCVGDRRGWFVLCRLEER